MSVLYPQFLYGLIAIAIPVFIHLFNLRRHKTVYFSNTAHLKAVQKKSKSTSQLRRLLTLLSRILFITALTLAFAQPYFNKDDAALKGAGKKVSIFTDNSLSMEVPTPEGTPLSRAAQHAFSILDDLNPRDQVQFLTHDFTGRDELFLNAVDVKAPLENLTVSASSKTFSEIVARTNLINTKKDSAELYRFVISDFQKSFWDIEHIKQHIRGKTILVPVVSTSSPNLAVDSLGFYSPVRYPDVKDSLGIRLLNTSRTETAKTKIELFLNGSLQSVISADLSPGVTDTVLFFNAKNTGDYHGEVRISDAAASFDNQMYFKFKVPESYTVIEISDQKLKSASRIRKVYEGDVFFNYQNYTPEEFDFTDIRDAHLIVVNEVSTASSGFWSELATYVSEGGHTMLLPSEQAEEVNNLFLNRLNAGRFGETDTLSGEVASVEYDHELFQGVFESEPENTLLPGYSLFFPYVASGSYIPILKNKRGQPVLSEIKSGKGKVFLWSINISNSEIASNTLWLPILYKAVFLSEPQSALYNVIGEGSTLKFGAWDGKKSEIEVFSLNAEDGFKPEVYAAGNELMIDFHGQIKEPGIYKVQTPAEEVLGYAAFNFSSAESKFEFANREELRAGLEAADFEDFEIWEGDFEAVQAKMNRLTMESTLWRWFILAACLFLGIETLLLRFLK